MNQDMKQDMKNFSLVDFTWKRVKEICPYCGKYFFCYSKKQIPNFETEKEKVCPNCLGVIEINTEYEFYTEIVL